MVVGNSACHTEGRCDELSLSKHEALVGYLVPSVYHEHLKGRHELDGQPSQVGHREPVRV